MSTNYRLLSRNEAQVLDQDLMGDKWGFSSDQLMELAGLSCACAIQKTYNKSAFKNVFVICGPGNNGGDGLVLSRHLYHFGYNVSLYYPKQPKSLSHMLKQLKSIPVTILDKMPSASEIDSMFQVLVDAIFGFSFVGDIRAPFDSIIDELHKIKIPIVAIDIPSGWDVNEGNVSGKGLEAETLISLTAPKLCAKHFKGKYHWLGGRFVPAEAVKEYDLILPEYPDCEQCVLLAEQSP